MQFTKHNLSNGCRLIVAPMQDTKTFTILVLFKVGSRYETKDINGISHYIEHLMFKGTKKRPNTLSISKELDSYGAEYNAFTGKDYTGYYVKINAEKKEKAMEILSDMLNNSKFDEKELNRERNVIIEEIHMYRDNPMMHIEDMIEMEIFHGSPLGWSIAGDEASMGKIGRAEIVKFFKEQYIPKNTVVIMAGNMNGADPQALAEKFFGVSKSGATASNFDKFPGKFSQKIKIEYKDTGQFQLAMAFPGLKYKDPQMLALNLLCNILGGTMSSRLFIKVRERKGLAYFVRAENSPYEDTGATIIRAGLNKGNLGLAVKTILAELADLKKKGVTAKELARAKDNMKGGTILSLEESSEIAGWLGRQELLKNEILTLEEMFARLDKVTAEDILALANKIFNVSKMSVALIGPMKDEGELKKLLK
jgi:predicted Zn-dependent peptidase